MVNAEIRANAPAETQVMAFDKAVESGAMALFGEKYESDVRVLRVGEFSMELCGGTHVERAGDIGLFKIVSEGGVAAGVRRIEALTGTGALDYVEQNESALKDIAGLVRGSREDAADKVREALDRIRQMEKEIRAPQGQARVGAGQRPVRERRRRAGRQGRRHESGRRRCGRAAQRGGSAQGQIEVGRHRAGLRRESCEGRARRRRDAGPDLAHQGGRARRRHRREDRR